MAILVALCAGIIAAAPADAPAAFTNSVGMTMVRIAPGRFLMGQTEGGDWDERPVHPVRITRAFHVAATEVTNAQYERFDPGHRALRGRHGLSHEDDEAVVHVSWHDAARFCRWLSAREGKPYRLPTEAEWEYACRAGTKGPYSTGDSLPEIYRRNQRQTWRPEPVPLHVGRTPPNPWGLCDMHGNVEEWCMDWYGPYEAGEATDPIGRADGDFKVTRGGSHGTPIAYLRSANRMGTVPEDRSWVIGFRVVLGEAPRTAPLPPPPPPRWAAGVRQDRWDGSGGPDPSRPFFRGPRNYVKIPPGSNGPLYAKHNHCPGLTACPNGDLLAIWYTTRTERGRELAIAASRLRRGTGEWEPAAPFWDAPDRNDHAPAIWWDGRDTIYHFGGIGTDATWGKQALVMRRSTDNGATWSKARFIDPEHGLRHMPIAGVFALRDGTIVLPCDAVTGGSGGTTIHLGRDGGTTWMDPGAGRPAPTFASGGKGAWIAGIHAGVVELRDGRLLAFGRGNAIDGRMPKSISEDGGANWTYAASPFPPIGGGQRVVLRRLREGPLFFASFARSMTIRDAAGVPRHVSGLFGALSFDEGETWPVRRLITDGGPPRRIDGGGNTHWFTLGPDTAEPKGYLACVQTRDGVIQLITSKQHYAFNLAWLQAPMPAREEEGERRDR